jgi:hypothetical protein
VKRQQASAGSKAQREIAPFSCGLQLPPHRVTTLALVQISSPIVADHETSQVVVILPRDLGAGTRRGRAKRSNLDQAELTKLGIRISFIAAIMRLCETAIMRRVCFHLTMLTLGVTYGH